MNLDDESVELLKRALNAADNLVTAVISGQPGLQRTALAVASALSDVERKRVFTAPR
jgi:hypothetical protein